MSDSNDLFNFPPNASLAQRVSNYYQRENNNGSDLVLQTTPKKKKTSVMYSYIKVPRNGAKIIRLEIFDAEKLRNTMLCECDANVCVQYVVDSENLLFDEIYNGAHNLIAKIQRNMSNLDGSTDV
ncbi:uncharacterized protein LOC123864684 [Maniola jurtina]|uniref:uncharacterized protein LOC123864684 n=1 Tax=Maniola jurtina TaxID=191418 RepID=UPI001E68D239|nr:uncharacterized protein LOC123864684 [Maniola jurtina]